jgi:transposase InsO family protein
MPTSTITALRHFLKRKRIAFIGHTSRRIMGFRFLSEKTSMSIATATEQIWEEAGCAPFAIWTDNGGEFRGEEFQDLLGRDKVQHNHTEPSSPRQNAKIERE